jgi:hypothetical protein
MFLLFSIFVKYIQLTLLIECYIFFLNVGIGGRDDGRIAGMNFKGCNAVAFNPKKRHGCKLPKSFFIESTTIN